MISFPLKTKAAQTALGTPLLQAIGSTPLIRLQNVCVDLPDAVILGKAEFNNPGGSVKDRAARGIILDAIEKGQLTKEKSLLDATSGNTGIAYAMICSALGYRATICLPANATPARKKILKAYGAELILTSPLDGSDGAIKVARQMYADDPDRYFYADQYSNDNNWKAHYGTTAEEIWRQTDGTVTHFVAALGTSGTFCGTTRRLKELNPKIQCVSMQPDSPLHGLEGTKHMPTALVPSIYDETLADRNMVISTDEAYKMARRLAREEGLLLGVSAAAAVATTLRLAREVGKGVFATVLCDNGFKYLTEEFWEADETDG